MKSSPDDDARPLSDEDRGTVVSILTLMFDFSDNQEHNAGIYDQIDDLVSSIPDEETLRTVVLWLCGLVHSFMIGMGMDLEAWQRYLMELAKDDLDDHSE